MNHFLAYEVGDFGGSASNDANLHPQGGHVPRQASWTPNPTVVGSIPTPSALILAGFLAHLRPALTPSLGSRAAHRLGKGQSLGGVAQRRFNESIRTKRRARNHYSI